MNKLEHIQDSSEVLQHTCNNSINPLISTTKNNSELIENSDDFVVFPPSVARENLTTSPEKEDFDSDSDVEKARFYIANHIKQDLNFSINCDWLEFWGTCFLKGLTNNYNVDTNLFYEISDKFYLTNFKNMSSAYYSTICDIYKMSDTENIKVATLVFNPKSCKDRGKGIDLTAIKASINLTDDEIKNNVVKDNEVVTEIVEEENNFKDEVSKCNLQIINRCLYEMNVSELIQDLFNDLNYKALSITRLDIAYDNTENIVNIVKDIDNNELPLLLKKQGQVNTQRTQRNGSFTGYKIGTSMSDKQVVCYNKSRELRKVKDKEYIRNSWAMSGIEDNEIWRTEFRFRGKALKKLDLSVNDFIQNIDQKQFLYEVSKKLNANMLQLKLRYKVRIEGKSTTKTEIFDLLPNLELKYGIEKKEVETVERDWYKIKLALHLAFKMMLFKKIDLKTFNTQIQYLFSLDINAEEWFATKSGIETTKIQEQNFYDSLTLAGFIKTNYKKDEKEGNKAQTWYEKYKKQADHQIKIDSLNELDLDEKKKQLPYLSQLYWYNQIKNEKNNK